MSAAEAKLAPATILCLGMDAPNRELLRQTLDDDAYELLERDGGEHALDSILLVDPDLLLLSLRSAKFDAMKLLGALHVHPDLEHLPVIGILPRGAAPDLAERARALGVAHCLSLPLDPEACLEQVHALTHPSGDPHGAPHVALGHLLDERYKVISPIGRGGKAKVYRALDTHADPPTEVALKVWNLGPDQYADGDEIRDFLREAYELSRLNHANIAHLVDFGQDEGVYYMATDFIQGESLEAMIARDGHIDEADAVDIARDVTAAMAHLREHDLVHRDIKPANIMLTPDGRAILVDFGLARRLTAHRLVKQDEIREHFQGSPHYASPEQVHGDEALSIRSDIYNLGATLYHAVSGRLLFDFHDPMKVLLAHLNARPARLAVICPHVSVAFACIIDRMLAKEPSQRPGLDKLRAQLDLLARGRSADMSDTWTQ